MIHLKPDGSTWTTHSGECDCMGRPPVRFGTCTARRYFCIHADVSNSTSPMRIRLAALVVQFFVGFSIANSVNGEPSFGLSVAMDVSGRFCDLEWPCQPGRLYVLERSRDLSSWLPVVRSTGPIASARDRHTTNIDSSGQLSFWRVSEITSPMNWTTVDGAGQVISKEWFIPSAAPVGGALLCSETIGVGDVDADGIVDSLFRETTCQEPNKNIFRLRSSASKGSGGLQVSSLLSSSRSAKEQSSSFVSLFAELGTMAMATEPQVRSLADSILPRIAAVTETQAVLTFPKESVPSAQAIAMEDDYEVLDEDPLIVWRFGPILCEDQPEVASISLYADNSTPGRLTISWRDVLKDQDPTLIREYGVRIYKPLWPVPVAGGDYGPGTNSATFDGLSPGTYTVHLHAQAKNLTGCERMWWSETNVEVQNFDYYLTVSPNPVAVTVPQGSKATVALSVQNAGSVSFDYSFDVFSSWFSASPINGTAATESNSHGVTLNTETLGVGERQFDIHILTWNGSQNVRKVTVPVTVTVVPATRVVSLAGDLSFAGVDVNTTARRTLTMTNAGNSTLLVTDVQTPPAFTASLTTLEIPAGESRDIEISFTPAAVQSYGGTITFVCNKTSGENTISCSGSGVSLRLAASPASINLTVEQGKVGTSTMEVWNEGSGEVGFNLVASDPGWISAIPSSGAATSAHQSIALSFDATSLSVGQHQGSISVRRTADNSEQAVIPVTLTVVAPASQPEFFGPTPYLGFGNSPFSGLGFAQFYLENFEDGALNTPGASASAGWGVNVGGDSVDEDDGAIDGSGVMGNSYYSRHTTKSLTITFNAAALGGHLPTHVGIVWTDVGAVDSGDYGYCNVTFQAFDSAGLLLGSAGGSHVGDGSNQNGTAEDRFFGVKHNAGIARITIGINNSTDWTVDHLQYGYRDP